MNHRLEQDNAGDADSDELLARAAQADPRRFEPLYDRYVDLVYRYCRRRLRDETAAEDATSTVFMKALAALPGFDIRANSFRSWLFTIAFNVVMDHGRARQRRPEEPLERADWLTGDDDGPDERFVAAERRRAVSAAIAQLSDDQRAVIELRLAGLNGHEISLATGRSHGAVRSAQHRALLRLRDLLRDEMDGREAPSRPAPEGQRR